LIIAPKIGALYTRNEAAAQLGISLVTLDIERKTGRLAYLQRKPGGKVWIPEAAIAEYFERALHPAKAPSVMVGYTYRKRRA
jgi:predicted site-specific integrase-resolvase